MASCAENSNSFTGPTIPWSSIIPTLWRSISRRVSIVRFGVGASVFCWLAQRWLALTDYQFTLSLVTLAFSPSRYFFYRFSWILYIFIFLFYIFILFIFNLFILFLNFLLFFTLRLSFFSFPLYFSPLGLFLIWVCVLFMSIDSKFVFEFIAWVMVIMLVHSTYQKCIYVYA